MHLKKIFSFLKRDFRISTSYKLDFVLGIIDSVFPVLVFFFLGKMISPENKDLVKYGGSYFYFASIGFLITNYFILALNTFTASISDAQLTGCIEALFSGQTKETRVILLSSVYSFIYSAFTLILMISFLVLIGFDFSNSNILAAVFSFFLCLLIYVSAGILSAAYTVVYKKGNPIGFLFGLMSAFIGGAYFPTTLFPAWMQTLGKIFPITHALEAIRLALFQNYSLSMLVPELTFLVSVAIILFPISLLIFKKSIEKAKREGTIVQY